MVWIDGRIAEEDGQELEGQLYLFGNLGSGTTVLDQCSFQTGRSFKMVTIRPADLDLYAKVKGQGFLQKLDVRFSSKEGHYDLGTVSLHPERTVVGSVQSSVGEPVAGVRVELLRYLLPGPYLDDTLPRDDPRVCSTEASGSFRFDRVPAGTYKILVKVKGSASVLRHCIVQVDAKWNREVLVKLGPGWVLAGQVVDPEGVGISGARIGAGQNASDPAWAEVTSDSMGKFLLRTTQKKLLLKIEKEGFEPTWVGRVQPAARRQVYRVERGHELKGQIIPRKGRFKSPARVQIVGNGVIWAKVRYETWTDLDGRFAFQHLIAGRYSALAYHKDLGISRGLIDVPKEKMLWFQFPRLGTMTLQVVSDVDETLTGWRVEIQRHNLMPGKALLEPIVGRLDAQGRFRFPSVSMTTLLWKIHAPFGDRVVLGVAAAKDGATLRILFPTRGIMVGTLVLDSELSKELLQAPVLQVTSESGFTILPVTLQMKGHGSYAFRVEKVPAGRYGLRLLEQADDPGDRRVLAEASATLDVQAGETLRVRCHAVRK